MENAAASLTTGSLSPDFAVASLFIGLRAREQEALEAKTPEAEQEFPVTPL
jgi:hypothetical protein